jgi:hypothetical protein
MTPAVRRALLMVTVGAIAASGLTGCAHGRRMAEIRTFEAGYFQLLQSADYDRAYESLHTEIKTLLPLDRYRTFFTVLTDTLGPLKAWTRLPNTHDRVALLDPQRRRDPLPPDNPKVMLNTRYRLIYEKGQATLVIRAGWDEGRMTIRGQFLCCTDKPTIAALRTRAEVVGVVDLFGVKPKPQTPPPGPPAGSPAPPEP